MICILNFEFSVTRVLYQVSSSALVHKNISVLEKKRENEILPDRPGHSPTKEKSFGNKCSVEV